MALTLEYALKVIDEWLDRDVAAQYKDQPLAQDWARISKVSEELGEAIQNFIGATGQNPRKGTINDIDDVLEELADTAITAMLAIQHFTKNADQTEYMIASRLSDILKRIL
jgi:hypothetical protein